jgi:hypothetical protein
MIAPLVAGCGGPSQVRGRVLLDGAPVSGATVTFMPVQGGRPASGITDADGRFRLMTFKKEDGILPGEYKVIVTRSDALPPPPEAEPGDADSILKHYEGMKASRKKSSGLPAKYGDADKTPLRCTVPASQEIVLNLETNPK